MLISGRGVLKNNRSVTSAALWIIINPLQTYTYNRFL